MGVGLGGRAALAVVFFVVCAAGVKGCQTYRHVRGTYHPPRGPVAKPPELAAQIEDVTLRLADGTPVAAWLLAARNGATVVYVHGASGDRRDLVADAAALRGAGYGAVLLDLLGHGASGGTATWGRSDEAAVEAAVDLAVSRGARVALLGFASGASIAARVAARDARVRAVVLTGAFTDARAQLRVEYARWGPVTEWPAVKAAEHEGIDLDELDSRDVVARIAPRPVRFVGGSVDRVVPPAMVCELFADAREPKELEIVPGADHGQYGAVGGDAYYERTRGFLDRALDVAPAPP